MRLLCFKGLEPMVTILGITYLTDKEASKRYGYSTAWFQKQRSAKKPPPFVKLQGKGKIYYPLEKVDEWFKENLFRY